MIDKKKIAIEIVLLLFLVGAVFWVMLKAQAPVIPTPNEPPLASYCDMKIPPMDAVSGMGVKLVKANSQDTTGEYIGLSDGKFAFNTSGRDGPLKCRASQALQQGHIKEAENLWTQAVQRESNDAEVLIYQENQRILDARLPFFSVVVGVVASGNVISNGLDILQGTYAAQKRYNQAHAGSAQLRVIIANFASTTANNAQVAQHIVTATQKDGSVKAMVNLPVQANTSDVLAILAKGDFPIILSNGSTSSSKQENGGNFFHIEAPAAEQGRQAAEYVEQDCPNAPGEKQAFDCKGIHITVFIDVDDPYSDTLANAFAAQLNADRENGATNKVVQVTYYDATNIPRLAQALEGAPPDLIYFAGGASDANLLLQNFPHTSDFANMRVLGGDALYQAGKYSAENYTHLNFTTFAYPDEWANLRPASATPEFFCDYVQDFAGGQVHIPGCKDLQTTMQGRIGYGYSRPENDVILSYDALEVTLVGNGQGAIEGLLSRDQLLQDIRNINESHPYEGVSGRIAFGPDGNPIKKAILVLRVDESGHTRQEQQYGTF